MIITWYPTWIIGNSEIIISYRVNRHGVNWCRRDSRWYWGERRHVIVVMPSSLAVLRLLFDEPSFYCLLPKTLLSYAALCAVCSAERTDAVWLIIQQGVSRTHSSWEESRRSVPSRHSFEPQQSISQSQISVISAGQSQLSPDTGFEEEQSTYTLTSAVELLPGNSEAGQETEVSLSSSGKLELSPHTGAGETQSTVSDTVNVDDSHRTDPRSVSPVLCSSCHLPS
mgnify:CR=1 FL=1